MVESVRASVSLGDKIVTFEGPQEFVSTQVEKYINDSGSSHKGDNSPSAVQRSELPLVASTSERELISAKQPKGHPQTVAVLAFALNEAGQPQFTAEDIQKAYRRAGVRPPKVVAQAIRDAKNLFDYVTVGSKRGTYKLSEHGDRTVRFDLPVALRERSTR